MIGRHTYELEYPPLVEQGMRTTPIATLTSPPSLPDLRCQATEVCSGRRQLAVPSDHWTRLALDLDINLPLCHSGEISHRGYCAQNPKQFGVCMDLMIWSVNFITQIHTAYGGLVENR
jgi:hypothetical protein